MRPEVAFAWFCAALCAIVIAVAAFFLIHDRGVTCHERVRSSDACWKDLNEKVRNLETRVQKLEMQP